LEGEKSNMSERIAAMEPELDSLRALSSEDESLRSDLEKELDQLEQKLSERDTTVAQLQEELMKQVSSQDNNVAFEASIQAIDEALQTARQVISDLKASSPNASADVPAQDDSEASEAEAVAGFEL